ncbi:MAG: Lrp/AsnC family transcriptional regulator [Gammaproteobacteria bacterium]|jgi:Lrp/AsnC family transcriptional regulator for asnA, asnC and gidA|nr:Lrp/AsnC family transcriptional regulator [Gammaproteobacteria bacterium]MDA7754050.1 Lrp/AsnC family transcriptional regulator [Pseudomonadales bacterium]MBT3707884.1 Lrp/AsnC family transcriptional regulator [Gammaproteobacteria bacterium]MBT3735442.1 Lrp/AsnC family transcriptional regulator [Gammaproteobacteria bacterium]MBT3900970.1 Lrp/AsnC family transcriptional regulator [Gammaproteobacteria bacterium]|tara:strand:- start:762 stop:1235 length:474 start_codon:yes stop_codon:yes gene_type:complete
MSKVRIDDVDRNILKHLAQDGRRSNRDIAQELGLGEGTVRGRIKRMQENNTIKIMALTSFVGPEPPQLAYIGVRADLRKVEETAKAIAEMEFVRFVATMMGRYDILVMTLVRDGSELVRLVNEEIMTLPGVRHADTTLAVKGLKYDYRWGRIVDSDQ